MLWSAPTLCICRLSELRPHHGHGEAGPRDGQHPQHQHQPHQVRPDAPLEGEEFRILSELFIMIHIFGISKILSLLKLNKKIMEKNWRQND